MSVIRAVVADDHAILRCGIANVLKEIPQLVLAAEVGNGRDLLPTLARVRPDLLLLDVVMPDFEPIAAVRAIRELYPAVKILVVSAHADEPYVQGLLRAGVDGYHLKDQSLGELLLAVQRVLAGERWVSSPLLDVLVGPRERTSPLTLTGRQGELACLLQQGLDNQAIARKMGLSVKTIEGHLTRLYRNLGVQSRLEAVSYVAAHPGVLPRVRAGAAPGAAPTRSEPPRLGVLLVDDNARYRAELRVMVGAACPQAGIYEAEDGAEAIDLACETGCQVAFVDVVLVDESGIECMRRLRKHSAAIQIIAVSAYPDPAYRRLSLDAGAAAFLDKQDLDIAAVRRIVDDILA